MFSKELRGKNVWLVVEEWMKTQDYDRDSIPDKESRCSGRSLMDRLFHRLEGRKHVGLPDQYLAHVPVVLISHCFILFYIYQALVRVWDSSFPLCSLLAPCILSSSNTHAPIHFLISLDCLSVTHLYGVFPQAYIHSSIFPISPSVA